MYNTAGRDILQNAEHRIYYLGLNTRLFLLGVKHSSAVFRVKYKFYRWLAFNYCDG